MTEGISGYEKTKWINIIFFKTVLIKYIKIKHILFDKFGDVKRIIGTLKKDRQSNDQKKKDN
jgi:hypothetical protein